MNRHIIEQPFRLGDRVCLSQLGKGRVRRPTTETGTVVGVVGNHNPSTVRVLFDGLKTVKSMHKTYIELLPDEHG
jgi:hypothetical protein